MPQDVGTIIRPGYQYSAIVWPGPTVSPASPVNLTNTAYDSGYFQLKNTGRVPFGGMYLVINIAGPISSTGATGSATLTPTVTFSTDGSTPSGRSVTLAPINLTFASSVGTITNTNSQGVATGANGTIAYWRVAEERRGWIRVQLATVMTTVTGVNYGLVGIAFQDEVDTEANNATDLG